MTANEYEGRVLRYLQWEYPTAVSLLASMDCPLMVNVALHELVMNCYALGQPVQDGAFAAAYYVDWAKKHEPSWTRGAK